MHPRVKSLDRCVPQQTRAPVEDEHGGLDERKGVVGEEALPDGGGVVGGCAVRVHCAGDVLHLGDVLVDRRVHRLGRCERKRKEMGRAVGTKRVRSGVQPGDEGGRSTRTTSCSAYLIQPVGDVEEEPGVWHTDHAHRCGDDGADAVEVEVHGQTAGTRAGDDEVRRGGETHREQLREDGLQDVRPSEVQHCPVHIHRTRYIPRVAGSCDAGERGGRSGNGIALSSPVLGRVRSRYAPSQYCTCTMFQFQNAGLIAESFERDPCAPPSIVGKPSSGQEVEDPIGVKLRATQSASSTHQPPPSKWRIQERTPAPDPGRM